MKRKRFTEEQKIEVLREWDAGLTTGELARKHGISEKNLYYWRRKYGGMDIPKTKRLKTLEDENRKLKRIVANQALEIIAIKDVLSKNW